MLASIILLCVLIAVAYACFCTPIAGLGGVDDDRSVIVVGRVQSTYGVEATEQVYEISDPSGSVFVSTQLGTPQTGTVVVVWGVKTSTGTSRPVIFERRRGGNF